MIDLEGVSKTDTIGGKDRKCPYSDEGGRAVRRKPTISTAVRTGRTENFANIVEASRSGRRRAVHLSIFQRYRNKSRRKRRRPYRERYIRVVSAINTTVAERRKKG